ncbi:hypothetical protein GCM10022600_02570 [Qipengyuania pelagi]|uniref:TrbC/VirB2 family protein n=1 Tax=Qipengyuania pelagi TaxID=994320 RepID=UPI002FE7CFFF
MFEAPATSSLADAVSWLTDLATGSLAVGLCVIAVALVGFAALTGRMPIRMGARVVLGCFVLLGAPMIAGGLSGLWQNGTEAPIPNQAPNVSDRRQPLPQATYDPYASASIRRD